MRYGSSGFTETQSMIQKKNECPRTGIDAHIFIILVNQWFFRVIDDINRLTIGMNPLINRITRLIHGSDQLIHGLSRLIHNVNRLINDCGPGPDPRAAAAPPTH